MDLKGSYLFLALTLCFVTQIQSQDKAIIGQTCNDDSDCTKADTNTACTAVNQIKTCQCKSGFSGFPCTANSAAGKSAWSVLSFTLSILLLKLLH